MTLYTLKRPDDHPGPEHLTVVLPDQSVRLAKGEKVEGVKLDAERDARLILDLERQGYVLGGEGAKETKKVRAAAPSGKRPIRGGDTDVEPAASVSEDPGI